jgi:RsiW-degrading membrane proteinase PrsW (M82 family)
MSQWSIPIQPVQQGWKLRVLSGTSTGKEYPLPPSRYVLGSRSPSQIVIPDPSIAPQHASFVIYPDHVEITDCSGGAGMRVNGKKVASARLAPGDHVTVGSFTFEFSNPGYKPPPGSTKPNAVLQKLSKLPFPYRVGLVTFAVAALLVVLLGTTGVPTLVPVTLLATSSVVPATLICFLVEKYDKTGISFHTLTLTFLAGGTIGIICTVLFHLVLEVFIGGLLASAVFAGLLEEPAKLLGTAWRWRHPAYDRPMDGLIIGTVSGFGFAVFETAGYGFVALAEKGVQGMVVNELVRNVLAPFGHGLWSGIFAAAFWQCGRDWKRAIHARVFQTALLYAIGLHALWNASQGDESLGFLFIVASGLLSVRLYRRLLANNGYRT